MIPTPLQLLEERNTELAWQNLKLIRALRAIAAPEEIHEMDRAEQYNWLRNWRNNTKNRAEKVLAEVGEEV